MFFLLSKILYYLILPVTWISVLLLAALILRNPKWKKRAFIAATALFLFFTNPFLANEAWLWWEIPAKPIAELEEHDAAIVLTGITNLNKSPHDRVYMNKGADRLLHALHLYRLGKVKKLIITGGSGSLTEKHTTEANELRKVLLLARVPESDILIEEESRNTHENAKFTKQLLSRHPEIQSVVLVTSAFHMRRSEGCFRKQGIEATLFSTDFYTRDRNFDLDNFVPDDDPLMLWQKLFHEMTGYVVYKLMGYI